MSSGGAWRPGGRSWIPPEAQSPSSPDAGPAELPGSGATSFFSNASSSRRSGRGFPRRRAPPPPTPPPAPPPPAKRFIAVGIDFGTTFSGVSWAYSADPETIHEVKQWPCLGQLEKEKDEVQLPTQIDLASKTWGYLVPRGARPIRWFKLLLLADEDLPPEVHQSPCLADARQQAARLGTDGVIDLIADFLRHLWEHAREDIVREIGPDDIEDLPFKIGLTIPAIWPQYARNYMKEAARRAGIMERREIGETVLMLVEEPEAAALATLFERKPYPEMDVGETFIVVDCGGGTVDIISYSIVNTEPFTIREAVKGDGKLCGAFLIDAAFEHHMQQESGLRFSRCESPEADFRMFVKEEWEYTMKRLFTGDGPQQEFYLKPPAKAFSRLTRFRGTADRYALRKETIKRFFAKTDLGTRQLVKDQHDKIVKVMKRPPKRILLVGGLGASRYLYKQLQGQFGNVIQPQRAWSAVARGAVIKLLKNTFSESEFITGADPRVGRLLLSLPEVESRISRQSYGVESGVPVYKAFPPFDATADRTSVDPDGAQIVWRMKWYLKEGDSVSNKDPVAVEFYEYVNSPAKGQASFRILTSEKRPAPVRKDESVKTLCTINCEYDRPFNELPLVDPRRGIRRVDGLHLMMSFDGEPQWRLQVGKNLTEQSVDVQFA